MTYKKIILNIADQVAHLMEGEKTIKIYSISTSLYGTGFEIGSNCTPLGKFKIHKKIGGDVEFGTVFRSRVPSGEICTNNPRSPLWQSPEDLVTSRILWLEGLDSANTNTLERYIYLHGTNQEHLIGTAASHGCIRFKNDDIIDLFDRVEEGTEVMIFA